METASESLEKRLSESRRLSVRLIVSALAVAILSLLVVHHQTFVSMVSIWSRSSTYVHCFLVPIVSAYLAWQKRPDLIGVPVRPFAYGVAVLFLLSAVWVFSDLNELNVGRHFAVLAMAVVCVPTFLGLAVARTLAFPLGYLLFAVPFGDFLIPTLVDSTAFLVVEFANLTDIPVLRDDELLHIPSGTFEVARACSGIRYLLSTLAVGTLFAYLYFHSLYKRVAFFAVSLLLPIVANGFRAYAIVAIGHLSNMKYAAGVDHFIYGWGFFTCVVLALFLIGMRFRDSVVTSSGTPQAQPSKVECQTSSRVVAVVLIAALIAFICGPLARQLAI